MKDRKAGTYEVLTPLGEGGMGRVYKVRHRDLDEVRVIKMIRAEGEVNPLLTKRFEREAKMMIGLRHPNVAHAFDSSVDQDGSAFLVLEYIDGITLKDLVAQVGAPSLGLGLEIARQSLDALMFIHEQGIVHRDIAADNLMLSRDASGEPLVKLIDLGIAKAESETSRALTQAGSFLGKARYTAPEQFAAGGSANLDQRSDVYSFGVVLYELLTGRCPIGGANFTEVLSFHLFEPPLDFAESDPEGRVPEGLRRAILHALEKKVDERLASAELLRAELEPYLERRSHAEEVAELFHRIGKTTPEPAPHDPGKVTAEMALRIARIFRRADAEGSSEVLDSPAGEEVSERDAARELIAAELMDTSKHRVLAAPEAQPRSHVQHSASAAEPKSGPGRGRFDLASTPASEAPTVRASVPDFVKEDARRRNRRGMTAWMWLVGILALLLLFFVARLVLGASTLPGAELGSQGEMSEGMTGDGQ